MRSGVHLNLGQGYEEALAHAERIGCTSVQIFTHSPRTFAFKELEPERQRILLDGWKRLGIDPIVSHASYLINVGSIENKKFFGALNVLEKELVYAKAFGCTYVVLHTGKHTGSTLEDSISQIARAIEKLKETFEKTGVMLLLETAAGQGSEIGATFEELRLVLDAIPQDVQRYIGVCLDTCHVFAAGYDIRTPQGAKEVLAAFDREIGLDRLKVVHVNDSKFELGEHKDRHERIDAGHIGKDGLRAFISELPDVPLLLETPWETLDEQGEDHARLREIIQKQ